MKAGNVFGNPVTGESGYLRLGTDETNGELLVADLRVRPGGAVVGEHVHPALDERFTVVRGRLGYKLDGKEGFAEAGVTLDLPRGIPHDWWNTGDEEARVIVQVRPAARFEQMAITMFSLAREGKTNAKGMPNLLQLAVISQEFEDVVQFMNPPIWVQRLLFGLLAPLGRLVGYRAIFPVDMAAVESVAVEPLPDGVRVPILEAARLDGPVGSVVQGAAAPA
jgi:quercetin dioxygenase-like cupin family protein